MNVFSNLLMSAVLAFGTFTAATLTAPAYAGGHITWTSVDAESRLAFGSIKRNSAGEVHHFNKISGVLKENGDLAISVDISSLETNIDIRNQRMMKHVFADGTATATITGQIDMSAFKKLGIGKSKLVEISATLNFLGIENEFDAEMLVVRLGPKRVLVTTADFIFLSTEDLEIDAGIDQLQKLAELSGITRATPIAIRMVFER